MTNVLRMLHNSPNIDLKLKFALNLLRSGLIWYWSFESFMLLNACVLSKHLSIAYS